MNKYSDNHLEYKYSDFYINLKDDGDQKAKDIFEGSFDADTIITNLTYRMYPMDFEEYLWANGIQDSTIEHLQDCFASFTPITELI